MILITGGTGFIGRALVRHLVEAGYPVRTLIRPSSTTPKLPRGVPVEIAVASLNDDRSLRAAMRDVDVIFHLIGGEGQGGKANLAEIDIQGTESLMKAAKAMGVKRVFYISHLGADRASAFPVLKAKGIAEDHIRRSEIPHTIIRASLIFGPEDNFTTGLAQMLKLLPGFFFLPGQGDTLVQPLWLEDLVTCLLFALENPAMENQTYEIGGSEYYTVKQIIETVAAAMGKKTFLIPFSLPYLRILTVITESVLPKFPASVLWLDYFSSNRTCSVDSIPRTFGLVPARFSQRLEHLKPSRKPNFFSRLFPRL